MTVYLSLIGSEVTQSKYLRPMISINLQISGYKLEKNVDKNGITSFKLTK